MTLLLHGRPAASKIYKSLTNNIKVTDSKTAPCLAIIMVGDDPSSEVYIKQKIIACQKLNFDYQVHKKTTSISQQELLKLIISLNNNKAVSGIICQLPLPKHIDPVAVANKIDPEKDVDCFNPLNIGKMLLGLSPFLPCTPAGILYLLDFYNINLAKKNVLVIGRSNIVGKPLAMMLAQHTVNATPTLAHSQTTNLDQHCAKADIIIVAVGKINLLKNQPLKKTAIIIDVGMNRLKATNIKSTNKDLLLGDVDFNAVSPRVAGISPVPGGVGPLTVAMLMVNVSRAYDRQQTL